MDEAMQQPGGPPVTAPSSLAVLGPPRPHDTLSFEELAGRYNYRLTSSFSRVLVRLVIDECRRRPGPVRALDIGCGQGIGGRLDFEQAIRAHVGELWGLDPDEAERPAPGRFDNHQHAVMEEATLPAGYFDVAFSCMVMEHVEDPLRFMRALARCLKPGGVYLFVTPNIRHYFTGTAALLHALRLDEMVLRFINPRGYEEYHYPVRYRFNSERRINAVAAQAGWAPPRYAYIEADDPVGYMRGPLRPILHLLAFKRRVMRNPRSLVTLVGRMTR